MVLRASTRCIISISCCLSLPTLAYAQPAAQPAPVAAPANTQAEREATGEAGFDKGFFVASGDGESKLKLGARVQSRFTYESLEDAADETFFSVPRARISLKGHVFSRDVGFKLQSDFGKGSVSLKDAFVDIGLVPAWLRVRAGQYKRPFSRQQINSSGRLQFVDRSITNSAFGAGRDLGVMLHNNYTKSPSFEYALGAFNGTGDKAAFSGSVVVDPSTGEGEVTDGKFSNVPSEMGPALVARVGYNSKDSKGYAEADLEGGPLRYSVGASGWLDFQEYGSGELVGNGQADFMVKAHGFSTTGAFYFCSTQDGAACFDDSGEAMGVHLQAGYVIGGLLEPAVRVAAVGSGGEVDDETELAFALSVYPLKHNLKLQTDVAQLSHNQETTTDIVWRTQLQLGF